MTVISGRKCCALSKKQDPLGCLERTLLESSTWNSTRCYLTWKASATPQGRLLFQLAPWTRHTDECEPGLWATPQERDYRTGEGHRWENEQERSRNLNDQVANTMGYKMWATASSRDWKDNPGEWMFNATNPDGSERNRTDQLARQVYVAENTQSGSLNPTWVEWLMGYPIGWTDLKDSEMPSSRKSHTKSLKESGNK